MSAGFTLKVAGHTQTMPVLHEWFVRDPDETSDHGYRIVEVTRASFSKACRYLRDTPWLEHGIASLMVSHFPLSQADMQRLPKGVPWLKAAPDIQVQLHTLRTVLFQPLESRGLICVGFVDLVSALVNGGEAAVSQSSGLTVAAACDALFANEELRAALSTSNMSICARLRANQMLDMRDFDYVGNQLESLVAEDSLIVVSEDACAQDVVRDGFELSVLTVSPRQ